MGLYTSLGLMLAMFFLAVTPGPGVLLTISNSLASGVRNTIPVIIGIVCGDLLFVLLALFGLAAISENFAALFKWIQLFGAVYLIWLGWHYWQRPHKEHDYHSELLPGAARFLSGFITIFGDPKIILFYIGFLQTFISINPLNYLDAALAVTIIAGVIVAVMLMYAMLAAKARHWLQNRTLQRNLNRIAGSIMFLSALVLLIGVF